MCVASPRNLPAQVHHTSDIRTVSDIHHMFRTVLIISVDVDIGRKWQEVLLEHWDKIYYLYDSHITDQRKFHILYSILLYVLCIR